MKGLGQRGLLLLVLVFVMNSCASNTEVVTESSTQPAAATVPGEKVPGEGGLAPVAGPGGPNAGVRW
jgi:hypothetical protein